MIVRVNKEKTRAILIATSNDDCETLRFLYDSHIVFGMYQLASMERMDGSHPDYPQYQKLLVKYPETKMVAQLTINSDFIPREK